MKECPKVPIGNNSVEAGLLAKYPPLSDITGLDEGEPLPLVAEPAVFTDRDGRVLAWSLPDLFSQEQQVGTDRPFFFEPDTRPIRDGLLSHPGRLKDSSGLSPRKRPGIRRPPDGVQGPATLKGGMLGRPDKLSCLRQGLL